MHMLRLTLALAVIGGFLPLGANVASAAPVHHAVVHHAGTCGEYTYWHAGKCVDARDRSGSAWAASMAARPAW